VITGIVTLDGEPLPDAALDMFPISGVGKVSVAKTNADGRYRTTVSPGRLSVVVLATRVRGKKIDPTGEGMMDDMISVVPARYASHDQTPFIVDPIEGQVTTIDFELEAAER